MKNKIILSEFGFVKFEHFTEIVEGVEFFDYKQTLMIYDKDGTIKTYFYIFSVQVLLKLVTENFIIIKRKLFITALPLI